MSSEQEFRAALDATPVGLPTGSSPEGRSRRGWAVRLIFSSALVIGCSERSELTRTEPRPEATLAAPSSAVQVRSASPSVLVGAGDIASCSSSGDAATAKLVGGIAGTVATFGDNAYEYGSSTNYRECYAPTWGGHKARTRPSPGNHDYRTSGASGYFGYFGSAAGPQGKGYYSYNLGSWHVIALNSNISMSSTSAQVRWLRSDLAAHRVACVLAYWHHPRFSSGRHGNSTAVQPLWQALYDAGADVVISGHDHVYERFAPQTPTGAADPARGIRQFVAGLGGRSRYRFSAVRANSQFRYNASYGVLKLELYPTSYTWSFINTARTVADRGSTSCH
jgi:acid phosphatase type 7